MFTLKNGGAIPNTPEAPLLQQPADRGRVSANWDTPGHVLLPGPPEEHDEDGASLRVDRADRLGNTARTMA